LAALPESGSDSSEDSDIDHATNAQTAGPGGGRSQLLEGALASRAERSRALSSSSTESGTYIADTPSAVYHASSSALMSRNQQNRDRYVVVLRSSKTVIFFF
uniref:Pecanex-like protein n=1 Tax=Gongylonema pulchrum TaxID=637853 RepID=A0A183DJD4_9BILA